MTVLPIFNIARGLWKEKPQAWGNQADVSSNLKDRLERIGIAYENCGLAMPFWNPGDQIDYSKYVRTGTITGASIVYRNNKLNFNGDNNNDRINLGSIISSDPLSGKINDKIAVIVTLLDTSFLKNFYPRIIDKSNDGNATNGWAVWRYNSKINLGVNGTTSGFNVAHITNKEITLGVTIESGDSNLFYKGQIISTTTTAFTFPATTANISIGNWNHSTDRNWSGDIASIFVLSDYTDEQVATLSENPYQLWTPPNPVYYSFGTAGATAALTGTAITDGVTESEIVTGGETIIITLTDDTWVATVGGDNSITEDLIAGIDSGQSEAAGWDAVVKANMVHGDITRDVDNVTLTIDLAEEATYEITADETITITIPATALTGAEAIVCDAFVVTNESDGLEMEIAMHHYTKNLRA